MCMYERACVRMCARMCVCEAVCLWLYLDAPYPKSSCLLLFLLPPPPKPPPFKDSSTPKRPQTPVFFGNK